MSFNYKNQVIKFDEESIFDYNDLEKEFISKYELEEDIKSQLKFYIDGKEITKEEELIDLMKPEIIIEVKSTKEETKKEDETTELKEKISDKPETEENNKVNEGIKNETLKDMDSYISEKFKENNVQLEKNLLEKNDEKIQSLKEELIGEIEKKINSMFSKNDINKKILEIDDKIDKLNQDYMEFKSIKIKYFNKFIEVFENKSISQDSTKNEQSEPSQKNEDIETLKKQNIKLKEMIKKLKKEKDELKDKYENELSNKGATNNASPQLENYKNENEKLKEEKENLNNKIKNLENELKKKSEICDFKHSASTILPSSKIAIKKYNCKLIYNKDNNYQYDEVSENKSIELNLTIKNEGGEDIPKNCEIQLINEITRLNIDKFKTKNIIKDSEEITVPFQVDLNTIKVNEDIDIKLKLVDENKKDISGAKCKLNIKIIKEEKKPEDEEQLNNNKIILEESDFEELFKHVDDILSIENAGENMTSFKEKLSELLDSKKEKYEGITEKTDYIENLKEDLLEKFS